MREKGVIERTPEYLQEYRQINLPFNRYSPRIPKSFHGISSLSPHSGTAPKDFMWEFFFEFKVNEILHLNKNLRDE